MGGEVRKKIIGWDEAPGQDYFNELFRVSKHQVIWGANYFEASERRFKEECLDEIITPKGVLKQKSLFE